MCASYFSFLWNSWAYCFSAGLSLPTRIMQLEYTCVTALMKMHWQSWRLRFIQNNQFFFQNKCKMELGENVLVCRDSQEDLRCQESPVRERKHSTGFESDEGDLCSPTGPKRRRIMLDADTPSSVSSQVSSQVGRFFFVSLSSHWCLKIVGELI